MTRQSSFLLSESGFLGFSGRFGKAGQNQGYCQGGRYSPKLLSRLVQCRTQNDSIGTTNETRFSIVIPRRLS